MIILGIDPGLSITGDGLIEIGRSKRIRLKEAGVIRKKKSNNISARLTKIYQNIIEIINEYKPEYIVLEKLYSHYRHPVTALLMGHARGVVCLAAGVSGIKLINYHAKRIKKAMTGKGQASKIQIQGMVQQLLGLREM